MPDKSILAEEGLAHFDRQTDRVWDSFKIEGRMQNEKWNITGFRCHVENCDSRQAVSR